MWTRGDEEWENEIIIILTIYKDKRKGSNHKKQKKEVVQ